MIPSNSLAALYGIAADCAERQVLGSDVTIDVVAIDETNSHVDIPRLLAQLRAGGGFGLVTDGYATFQIGEYAAEELRSRKPAT